MCGAPAWAQAPPPVRLGGLGGRCCGRPSTAPLSSARPWARVVDGPFKQPGDSSPLEEPGWQPCGSAWCGGDPRGVKPGGAASAAQPPRQGGRPGRRGLEREPGRAGRPREAERGRRPGLKPGPHGPLGQGDGRDASPRVPWPGPGRPHHGAGGSRVESNRFRPGLGTSLSLRPARPGRGLAQADAKAEGRPPRGATCSGRRWRQEEPGSRVGGGKREGACCRRDPGGGGAPTSGV